MQELARKLTNLREQPEHTDIATAIFGTAGLLARSLDTRQRVRIGVWPCISADSPELAMGLFTVLAFLLERWQDVRVYRLFARLSGNPGTYQWSMSQSQFDIDDWSIDPLDENVAIWGKLEHVNERWILTLEIDNDLDEQDQEPRSYEANSISALVNLLPKIAQDIANITEVSQVIFDTYPETQASDSVLSILLAGLFHWQVNLFLSLWGASRGTEATASDLDKLIAAAETTGDDFGVWCVANAAAHAMSPGYGEIAKFVAPITGDVLERFSDTVFPTMFFGQAQFELGNTQRAYELLEGGVAAHPDNIFLWQLLGDLYRRGGKIIETVNTYQRAIEADTVSAGLYRRYAEFMNLLRGYTGDYVLIDPDDYDIEEASLWEAIEAYEEALNLAPDQVSLLQAQLLLLADVATDPEDEAHLWEQFELLALYDKTGEAVRSIITALEGREHIDPIIGTLEKRITLESERADLYINLAAAYLIAEEGDRAADLLEKAEELTDDPDMLADIDRLRLTAENPDFEIQLGEIIGVVNSGGRLKREQIDFLVDTIKKAPSMPEAYVLSAKAYLGREDTEAAMGTLLDGLNEEPNDPDMIELLAQMLWDSGEQDLAFDYLNKGVAAHPNYIPLLALAGRYLFEADQKEVAKLFLARAETIAPQHPALARVRAHIARLINRG